MTITIKLNTDNTAFEDDKAAEVGRILSEWMLSVQRGGIEGRNLRDSNGNTVGSVTVRGK